MGRAQDGSLLLRGKDLAEAERVLAANAGKEPRPTELQQQYLHASRRAATRRQRALLAGVTVALGVAIALGIASLLQRNTAIRERNAARSVALASASDAQAADHLDAGLLLGLEANRVKPSFQARSSMVSALEAAEESRVWGIVRTGAPVYATALSADGQTLAAGRSDGAVILWDLSTHRQLGPPLRTDSGAIQSLAFSHDGKTLATGGGTNPEVLLWNLGTRKQVGDPLAAPAGTVDALAFTSDDGAVAGVTDRQALLWDVGTHRLRGRPLSFDRTQDDFTWEAFSPDGRVLVRQFLEGDPEFWRVGVGDHIRLTRIDQTLDDWRQGVSLAAGDRTLAAEDTKGVRLWDLRTGHVRVIIPSRYTGATLGIALAPDGRTIATGSVDGIVRLSSTRVERPAARKGPAARYTRRVAFTTGGRPLSAGTAFDGMRVGASSGPRLAAVRVGLVADMAFSSDGKLAVAAARDEGLAEIWNIATGNVVRRLEVDADGVAGAALSPDGTLAVTGDETGRVRLWRVATGKGVDLPKGMDGGVHSVAFSPDGKLVAAGGRTGTTRLWNVASRSDVGVLDTHIGDLYVSGLAFSPDGTRVATAGDDALVRLWDVETQRQLGTPMQTYLGGNAEVNRLAFSPDGRTIASGDALDKLRLWDVESHQQIGDSLPGSHAAFSPDGRSLLVAIFNGGTTRLWRGILWRDLDDLRARVCGLVWGNLTKVEWATYAPGLPPHATCAD